MAKKISRREAIKTLGITSLIAPSLMNFTANISDKIIELPSELYYQNIDFIEPLTCVIIGGGNRGWAYATFAEQNPNMMKVIGVAEPVKIRRDKFKDAHNIPEENIFETWEQVFEKPKFADFVIISTWDRLHYAPAMKALEMGYNVLLEKAIAQSWEQCQNILNQSKKNNGIVGICHVLRYTPYFNKMREVIQTGEIGDVISIQHLEPIGNIHFSHSFVRGNWRNEKESTPSLLSKSCHDLDIIYWLLDKKCKQVSSFGSLNYFNKANSPMGSAKKCTGGCEVESKCTYSAKRIYFDKKEWGVSHLIDLQPWDSEKVMKALNEGPYGNCVFQNDNDVVDHQIVNMVFEDNTTAAFSMEAHTSYSGRRTRIMGTLGDIIGDENNLTVSNFNTRESITFQSSELKNQFSSSGHGGGDHGLLFNFLNAVYHNDSSLLSSTIENSMESHYIGFKAEESRNNNGKLINL
ncbi:MAG: Gfo/Idh/MocA family oxidoreductase [Ignavibacteriales bacterium]|nr:Gfo/Idh/MocA family oxidoreductase [Ignavibacteriales bacterium]